MKLSTKWLTGGALLLAATFFLPTASLARVEDDLFALANEAYFAGEHGRAIDQYRDILESAGPSSALLYNLARAHQERGDRGEALLYYEQAAWLAPRDPQIQAGLKTLRTEASLFGESAAWENLVTALSIDEWTWLAFGGLLLLALVRVVRGLGIERSAFPKLSALAILILLVSGVGFGLRSRHSKDAIVLVEGASLLVSPYSGAEPRASLREGRRVRVLDEHGGFVRIAASSGSRGWMREEDLGAIAGGRPRDSSQ